jgi:riboflavin synthase
MFTGIVEETGVVDSVRESATGIELLVLAPTVGRRARVGESIAVNGCCLTVVKLATRGRKKLLRFDLLRETWQRTNLQFAKPGSLVNLERSLRADSRLGGHFVTGHIDLLGKITRWERRDADHVLDIAVPRDAMRYLIFKGSIAVDGISLTVAKVFEDAFRIWIIPHTFEVTTLRERRDGDAVNIEFDLLGKYVERMLNAAGKNSDPKPRSRAGRPSRST